MTALTGPASRLWQSITISLLADCSCRPSPRASTNDAPILDPACQSRVQMANRFPYWQGIACYPRSCYLFISRG
ncbi:hypothetical protein V8C42DRAFT_314915 [Trichoderma barbatum]